MAASPILQYLSVPLPLPVSLFENPISSHLEAIKPVALSKTCMKQLASLKADQEAGEIQCEPGYDIMHVQLRDTRATLGGTSSWRRVHIRL